MIHTCQTAVTNEDPLGIGGWTAKTQQTAIDMCELNCGRKCKFVFVVLVLRPP